jgi:TolB-like protein
LEIVSRPIGSDLDAEEEKGAAMAEDPAGPGGTATRPQRRSAAVAVADVVGSSIMVGMAPDAAHQALTRLQDSALVPLALAQGARFQRSTGDGTLVEFPGADAALAWALAAQRAAAAAAADPQALPIALRISIDVGEVMVAKGDIIGQCLNIAARLQEHAPPGGLAISEAARLALSAPPPGLVDIGSVALRNILGQVRVALLLPESPPRVPRPAPLEGRPAVAVLPFRAEEEDEATRYFNEGVIEDIILSLGALHELAVIARGATLGWSPGAYDPSTLGRMLGVRYLVSGRLRRRGDGLRLRVDLHETQEGDQIWGERFDIPLREIFLLQDHVVERTVAGIAPTIRAAELRRALRDNLVRPMDLVMLTRERIEEAVDDAVERGRMTRKDAQAMARDLIDRGRKQTNDVLRNLEGLVETSGVRSRGAKAAGRVRRGVEDATGLARNTADPALVQADRARRVAGVGSSFPITGYDDLTAQQVQNRLDTLSAPELRKVRDYERRNANRKSVLTSIEQKLDS